MTAPPTALLTDALVKGVTSHLSMLKMDLSDDWWIAEVAEVVNGGVTRGTK